MTVLRGKSKPSRRAARPSHNLTGATRQIARDADMTRSDRITAEGESAYATFTDESILRGG
jgi:hypothetical protein